MKKMISALIPYHKQMLCANVMAVHKPLTKKKKKKKKKKIREEHDKYVITDGFKVCYLISIIVKIHLKKLTDGIQVHPLIIVKILSK